MGRPSAREFTVLDPARAEICRLVQELDRDFHQLSVNEIGLRAVTIGRLGKQHGFDAIRQLASGLADALARDGRGAIISAYLEALSEATACETSNASAGTLFLAAVSVRLAG